MTRTSSSSGRTPRPFRWEVLGICSSGGHAVVTFLLYSKDAMRLYHGRAAHPLQANAAYVFAPFAWSVFGLSSSFPTRRGIAIKIWDESACEWKLRSEPELPAQRPKRNALTQGGPLTPKVPEAAMRTHRATPPATSLPGKVFIEDLYRRAGGEDGLLGNLPTIQE